MTTVQKRNFPTDCKEQSINMIKKKFLKQSMPWQRIQMHPFAFIEIFILITEVTQRSKKNDSVIPPRYVKSQAVKRKSVLKNI